jgi:hypothetical protein
VTPNQSIDEAIPPYLVPVESEFIGGLDVLEFDMGRMSLERISAPIYPESRMQLGVASWLQRTFELPGSTVISIEGKSDRFTGERNVQEIESVASADEKAPFFFNHLPR